MEQPEQSKQGGDRNAELDEWQTRTDGEHDYVIREVSKAADHVIADKYNRSGGHMLGRKFLEPISAFVDETKVVDSGENQ